MTEIDVPLLLLILKQICFGSLISGLLIFFLTLILQGSHLFDHDTDLDHDIDHDFDHSVGIDHGVGDIGLDTDIDIDDLIKIDYHNILGEILTFSVIMNRIGNFRAEMEELMEEAKVEVEIKKASRKHISRVKIITKIPTPENSA